MVAGWLERWGRAWRRAVAAAGGGTPNQVLGRWGELEAAAFLRRKGWKILARNVRYGGRLELDLVARQPKPDTLVFVEVKTSENERFGRPLSRVDAVKRKTMAKAAWRYLKRVRRGAGLRRFDVVEVVGRMDGREAPTIRHIENAFQPDGW
ncbi:MAG: YraN family protein [Kiritimatiellae bacterium]|nr:YraN family protein [Kiritimatiellia bacterium]